MVVTLVSAGIFALSCDTICERKVDFFRKERLAWVCLACYVFKMTVQFLNVYPMLHKAKVMRGNAGNLRANMYIYQAEGTGGHVVLSEKGDVGFYNRANRSLHHFVENMAAFGVCFPVVGYVQPQAACALTCHPFLNASGTV